MNIIDKVNKMKYKIKRVFIKNYAFLFGLLATVASIIVIYDFLEKKYINIYGSNTEDIQVLNLTLIPHRYFLDKEIISTNLKVRNDFYATANISVTIKNYSDKKVFISSYTIKKDKDLMSTATSGGKFTIDINPHKSTLQTINAGEKKTFFLSQGINLRKIMPFFNTKDFKDAIYFKHDDYYMISNINSIKAFNNYIDKVYNDSNIELFFYSNYKKLIKIYELKLSDGYAIANGDGKFDHGSFLAMIHAIKKDEYDYGKAIYLEKR